MRVTQTSTYVALSAGLNQGLSRVQNLQAELASGRRIQRYSDDPVGAASALRLRGQEDDWAAYQRAADDAGSALGTTDGALQTMSSLLRRVRELAVSAVNGTLGPAEHAAIGEEIGNLRDQLKDVGNTRHLGRAVFGGFQQQAVRVDTSTSPPTWSYAGDSGLVKRQVSPTVTVDINLNGPALFGFAGPAGEDIFSVLDSLEANVRAGNNAGIGLDQARLQTRTESVQVALGQVGARQNRVESASQLGRTVVDRLTAQRSAIEDVDIAEAILKLSAASTGYQAALGAVARADLPSLANFLH